MSRRSLRRIWLAVLIAGTGGALLLAGVGCPPRGRQDDQGPTVSEGVPTIRVLISSGQAIPVGTTGAYRILADGLTVAAAKTPLAEGELTRQGQTWAIHESRFPGGRLAVEGVGDSHVIIDSATYRGRMAFHPGGAGILAVNHVDLESYLAGVVSRELYPKWHMRTYQAQAIAARTYAMYEMATVGKGRPYDLHDDQSSQVYGGSLAETQRSWQAVRSTHAIVLAAGPEGSEKIFRAHYSACCGGLVNPVHMLYGPPVTSGPLAGGQACEDCRSCPRHTWPPVLVPKHVIHRALVRQYRSAAALDEVQTIKVVSEFQGRPVWVDVVGRNRKKLRIRAADLRLSLLRDGHASARGLHSTNCRIRDAGSAVAFEDGRGFGHGVGLCQWGAQGKAAKGATVKQILQAYYPTAKLFQAY